MTITTKELDLLAQWVYASDDDTTFDLWNLRGEVVGTTSNIAVALDHARRMDMAIR